MVRWVAKAVVQKSITALPTRWHQPANGILQRHVTKGTVLSDRVFTARAGTAARHAAAGAVCRARPVLELGTGWFPVVPVAMHLCGFEAITSVDLASHCSRRRLLDVVERFVVMHYRGTLGDLLPDYDRERADRLAVALENPMDVGPGHVGLTLVIGDVRELTRPTGGFGLVVSNHVLEHIPTETLASILASLKHLVGPNAIMSHLVDLSDHFSHLDPAITPYNFLRFSEWQWRIIDNSIQPQSRLRVDDYRSMLAEAGWTIIEELTATAGADLLEQVPLHRDFSSREPAMVAVTSFAFVAVPDPTPVQGNGSG